MVAVTNPYMNTSVFIEMDVVNSVLRIFQRWFADECSCGMWNDDDYKIDDSATGRES